VQAGETFGHTQVGHTPASTDAVVVVLSHDNDKIKISIIIFFIAPSISKFRVFVKKKKFL